jgi:D-serine deaminase-like pyridoxal phosphate-dependent protein
MVFEIELGMPINRLDTPALLIDLDVLEKNIAQMAAFFEDHEAVLRPHMKTHKCPRIAKMQLAEGAVGITCAKVSEAEVFASSGISDILIANQVTGEVKLKRLAALAEACDLKVAVDNPLNVENLERVCAKTGTQIGVLVEVDIGMKRCGVQPGEEAVHLAKIVDSQPHLEFKGLQAYEGHLVLVEDVKEREEQVRESFQPLQQTCDALTAAGMPPEIVSGGGTGTYDISGVETPLNEVQVGSYVFMDKTYHPVRPEYHPSLSVLSTVLSRPVPERLVFDAGLKSMTSEFGWPEIGGQLQGEMNYLSEEHAVFTLQEPSDVQLGIGDKVQFLPSHCCTTVNLHEVFFVHQDNILVDTWEIEARGCSQ